MIPLHVLDHTKEIIFDIKKQISVCLIGCNLKYYDESGKYLKELIRTNNKMVSCYYKLDSLQNKINNSNDKIEKLVLTGKFLKIFVKLLDIKRDFEDLKDSIIEHIHNF